MSIPAEFAVRDQREPGWFYIDNEIVDVHGVQLGAYGIAVYNVLSRYQRNQQVSLSQRDIAAALGISQDAVRTALKLLAEVPLIYIDVPTRRSPGLVSTITLLRVKTSERHAFSSAREVNATRSRNKEVKTKTETENKLPPTPLTEGGVSDIWQNVCTYLKDDLSDAFVKNPLFQESAYDKYFRDAWLKEIKGDVAVLESTSPEVLQEGVEKFHSRLVRTFRGVVGQISVVRVSREAMQMSIPS